MQVRVYPLGVGRRRKHRSGAPEGRAPPGRPGGLADNPVGSQPSEPTSDAFFEPMQAAARDFLEYLEKERRLSPRTLKAYRSDLRNFFVFLKARGFQGPPNQLSAGLVRAYLGEIHNDTAPRTRARKLSAIRSLYRFLVRRGQATQNVGERVPGPKLPQGLPRALTVDEMFGLLDAPWDKTSPLACRGRGDD